MVHFLTYEDSHTFDLMLSCPSCGSYCESHCDLLLPRAYEIYNNWKLFGDCYWCGGGDGLFESSGAYYRKYGVYVPFKHLCIAADVLALERMTNERDFSPYTNDGFAIRRKGNIAIDCVSGKIIWSDACDLALKEKVEIAGVRNITKNFIRKVQNMVFVADYNAIVYGS